jgi:hypothetical protein
LFAKSKGTRKALSTLLRTFGITEQLINVREEGTPESSSVYVYDEFTSGLDFDEGENQYIRIPLNAAGFSPYPRSMQLSLTAAKAKSMTVLNGDDLWKLDVKVHPTYNSLGRFELISGSTTILSSSYEHIFGDELLNVAIRTYTSDNTANLTVTQTDGEDTIFSTSETENISSGFVNQLWNLTDYVYVGGSGSLITSNFDGTIDEIRLWGINLSNEMTENTAFDPGSNAGDAYTDASDYLYAQVSFNLIDTASISTEVINESPYKDKFTKNVDRLIAYNIGTEDIIRYSRTAKQAVSEYGQAAYVTRKIKVVAPPVFENNFLDDSGTYHLSRTKSIITPRAKRRQQFNKNKVAISISPTQVINTNIIRNLGLENINSMIGVPVDFYNANNTSLQKLKKHYAQYYYADINVNQYIRILSSVASVLNQVVNYFVPSRASLLQGFVLEQNILERVYLSRIKNIRFYGGNDRGARRTINAANSLTSSNADYEATFNLSQAIPQPDLWSASAHYNLYTSSLSAENPLLSGSYNTYSSSISNDNYTVSSSYHYYTSSINETNTLLTASYHYYSSSVASNSYLLSGSLLYYSSSISSSQGNVISQYKTYNLQHLDWYEWQQVSQSNEIHKQQKIDTRLSDLKKIKFNNTNLGTEGAEPFNRVYARKLFQYEVDKINNPLTKGIYLPALYEIKPIANFENFSVVNFYSQPEGVYYFEEDFKTPVFKNNNTKNASWDPENNTFASGVTTWSYGERYSYGDVVYQKVDKYSSYANLLGSQTQSALAGNERYYVFSVRERPSLVSGSPGFAPGSKVPSYVPPSLDQNSWKTLRFSPFVKRKAYRITYDTTIFSDPKDNDYNTLQVELDTIVNENTRYVDTATIPTIAANSSVTGNIALQNIMALFGLESTLSNIRVRLYRTLIDATNDLSRSATEDPASDAGVLLDMVIDQAGQVIMTNPSPMLIAGDNPPGGVIYYTVNNLTGSTLPSSTLYLYYFALQVQNRIPIGYLPTHYRFFRDNSTATKRRNWLGCKNTDQTTADGLPVVQVTIKEGTQLNVSTALQDNEITLGGGGTLEA